MIAWSARSRWFAPSASLRIYIFLSCLSLPALAQTSPAATAAPLQQSEAAGSGAPSSPDRRITLDVVVTGKPGKPLSGLEQQDFTVLDNKQPQKIVSFYATDQATQGANPAVEVVLVVDEVNFDFQGVAQSRGQIEKFLRLNGGQLAQPVSIVYLSDSGTTIDSKPTRDGNALASALEQQESSLRTMRRSEGFYGAVDRAQFSLHALGQIADYESKRPGRKMLIWLSPGWAILSGPGITLRSSDEQQIFNSIAAISTGLRQAHITLYSVDPLGTEDAGSQLFYYQDFLKGISAPKQAQMGDLALQVLATQSGGRVLNSSNDVSGEIGSCVQDANAFYVLSFDSPPADRLNEYHAVSVTVDKPGLTARTRTGYYAQP